MTLVTRLARGNGDKALRARRVRAGRGRHARPVQRAVRTALPAACDAVLRPGVPAAARAPPPPPPSETGAISRRIGTRARAHGSMAQEAEPLIIRKDDERSADKLREDSRVVLPGYNYTSYSGAHAGVRVPTDCRAPRAPQASS
jgi:hypothetical protein